MPGSAFDLTSAFIDLLQQRPCRSATGTPPPERGPNILSPAWQEVSREPLAAKGITYYFPGMNKPLLSRLTSKGQATIPVEVRRALRLHAGDRVAFDLKNGKVTLRRADSLDPAFLKLSEIAFEEWNS